MAQTLPASIAGNNPLNPLTVLRAILDEVTGPNPYSADSYLPAILVAMIRAALDQAEGGQA